MANVFETDGSRPACDVNVLMRTDTTNCATLTEKELSQQCAVVNTETQHAPRTVDSFSPTVGFQELGPAKNSQLLD